MRIYVGGRIGHGSVVGRWRSSWKAEQRRIIRQKVWPTIVTITIVHTVVEVWTNIWVVHVWWMMMRHHQVIIWVVQVIFTSSFRVIKLIINGRWGLITAHHLRLILMMIIVIIPIMTAPRHVLFIWFWDYHCTLLEHPT